MSVFNKNWYEILVEQSPDDGIYDLIHNYLTPDWNPGHDLDFVVVRHQKPAK